MTSSSWKQFSGSLRTSRMQQKQCCIISKSRSEKAMRLPPVLLGFSLWEKKCVKFGYPEAAMLERPHVNMPVKSPTEFLAQSVLGQFSFHSQRRTMPKNVQTTAQLHSSHMLAKKCSKYYKPGFNSMRTMSFQMFKPDLEKEEEPEIKLPPSVGS